jgi:peptide maturation system protein (TIGR04066 family)
MEMRSMLKKKAMIYPVDRQSAPVLRYNFLLQDYDIMYAVSPKGWGLNGKDCGVLDGGNKINKKVTNDFDMALDLCDCVIFTESDMKIDFEKIILPKMEKALEVGKDVVCTLKIPHEFKEKIDNICKNKGSNFKYYKKEEIFNLKQADSEYIYDINVPVMGVFGVTERSEKFNMQLALRQKLIEQGYKVSQIGTRHYSELLGFHSFPKFMMSNNISESNKIMLFNHYIKKIEIEEEPDIILVGVPGGVLPYNNRYTNRFGIMAFEVCNAIQFDSVVINTLYGEYKDEYFTTMQQSLRYRLGIEIDAFNFTPLKCDFELLDSMNRFDYLTLSSDFLDYKIKDFNNSEYKVFNVLNDKNRDELVDYLVDKLSSYSDIQAI